MSPRYQKQKTEKEHKRERVDRIIAERFRSSSMNDAKWVRLLDAISPTEDLIQECRVKLAWDDEIRFMQVSGIVFEFD